MIRIRFRTIIIPRGDTGFITFPNDGPARDGDIAIFSIYDKLLDSGIPVIIDDRSDLSLGSRINDVYMVGTPKLIVIGNKFDGTNLEIENTLDGSKESVSVSDIVDYFKRI